MNLEIPLDEQSGLFKEHFEEQGNDRIIFSGAFGTGKTYFLDKYFAPSQQNYLAIKLAPVNYSISSNEDIFKLIKYDILFELSAIHSLSLEGRPVDWGVALGTLIPAKAEAILGSFLPLLSLLNKDADAIPVALAALASWLATGKEVSKQRDSTGKEIEAIAFGEEIAAKYNLETDYITAFLEDGLTSLATNKGAQYKVLIIDDLDRIDPEHIFRLFNIFSAHLDYHKSTRNKFGFDKVIFVCDIQNIRNIFHSRYGADTDFTGYIDKFFSKEIHFFSNESAIAKYVDSVVDTINFKERQDFYFQTHILQGRNYDERGLLHTVLNELIQSGALKMRRLKECIGLSIPYPSKNLNVITPAVGLSQVSYTRLPGLVTLEILSKIMGGGLSLSKALKTVIRYEKSLEYNRLDFNYSKYLIGILLPLLDYKLHRFNEGNFGNPSQHSFIYNDNQTFNYLLSATGGGAGYYYADIDGKIIPDLFLMLDLIVGSLLQNGILK